EDIDGLSDETFQEWVIQTCGFFVTIYDNQLFFIHQTARQFLVDNPDHSADALAGPRSFRGSVSDRLAHATMTECCIAYFSIDSASKSAAVKGPSDRWPSLFKFLKYAMDYWWAHFRRAQEIRRDERG